jgi:hypothetical protein
LKSRKVSGTALLPSSLVYTEDYMQEAIREAVGLFDNISSLQDAVRALENTAFPRQDISVLGNRKDIEEKFGSKAVSPAVAEDNPEAPRQSPVRTEEQVIGAGALVGSAAYIGAVAAAIAAGAVSVPATIAAVALGGGSGALAGGILAKVMGDHYTQEIKEQVDKGGLLLWVRTPDEEREHIACDIMQAHGAKHVKVHTIH